MNPGMSFKKRYLNLPHLTNQNIVEKECFRLMRVIRNGFVHNISAIQATNDLFHFNYIDQGGNKFNLDISSDKLQLLYSIILILVRGEYEIATEGHLENVICMFYSELKNFVDVKGNFIDDGDMGNGAINSFKLLPISSYIHLNTCMRYLGENPNYDIDGDRITIKSIYNTVGNQYSVDYCVRYNKKEYAIPQEVLDLNNSVFLSNLSIWELKK
jgi:hypothetical protein